MHTIARRIVATSAAVVGAALLGAGPSAAAVAPAFTTPYVDLGCMCSVMYPGTPTVSHAAGHGEEAALTFTITKAAAMAPDGTMVGMAYWLLPPGAGYDDHVGIQGSSDVLARGGYHATAVQYIAFHGSPAAIGEFTGPNGLYLKELIFSRGNRVVQLSVCAHDRVDADASWAAFTGGFQIL